MLLPSSPFDAQLSEHLNDVPLPDGFLGRLRLIPLTGDADFDRALADIAAPADLKDRLSAIASPSYRAMPSLVKQAAAAVVMFGLGLGYVFSVTALVQSRFEEPLLAAEPIRSAGPLLSGVAMGDETWVTLAREHWETPSGTYAEGRTLDGAISLEGNSIVLAELTDPAAPPAGAEPMAVLPQVAVERLGMWSTERASVQVVGEASFEMKLYERAGALPWFSAASHGTITVELAADDASYRYCRREVGSGRLPFEGCVRVEEFLTAFNCSLVDRRPGNQDLVDQQTVAPRLRTAAAPSPFGGPLADTLMASVECRRWLVAVGIKTPEATDPDEVTGSIGAPLVTLRFVPERVQAYRIIGYGLAQASGGERPQVSASQAAGEPIERSPASGRESTILVEITLSDGGPPPARLGDVRLDWRDARGGAHAAEVSLDPGSFAEHFEVAPPGWRQAAVVALAAESLAASPFAEHVSLAEVAALARKIEPLVDDQAGWREFIDMIGKAHRLKVMSRSIGALARPSIVNYR
ncbi:MAG TPA: von Willebrand factor type A domain-containing protein [Pirellulales bacterium]|nr:von Willebrand factor type A domain-containing protein [Pirellulales bacterium]